MTKKFRTRLARGLSAHHSLDLMNDTVDDESPSPRKERIFSVSFSEGANTVTRRSVDGHRWVRSSIVATRRGVLSCLASVYLSGCGGGQR